MKKGEIYEGIIESVDFPNKGNVWVEKDGDVPVRVIVKMAFPGRKSGFRFIKKKEPL